MNVDFSISNYLDAHNELTKKLNINEIQEAIELIKLKFNQNKKIITCGNGGSASTASHYITDWNKMVNLATGKKFRGISLCDNIGLITAYANDLSYDEVFSGQLATIADPGDLLIVVSGSGNSPNILNALEYANHNEINTLAILGYDGGRAIHLSAKTFLVPSFDMQLCEDIHLKFCHMVMKELCSDSIRV